VSVLTLAPDEVHVWRASLDLPASRVCALGDVLVADERARAARFHFERDRTHWTVARARLRLLLARYLGGPPDRFRFALGAHGKPALARPEGGDLRFNVSHSQDLALYAVTRGREVGVDLEGLRPDFATDEIAERFFSPAERRALRAVAPELRCDAFFACWTRKEAYIKARGLGLAIPLDAFDVSLAPDEPAALLATRDEPGDSVRWSLAALSPGPGFAGALVAEGHEWRVTWLGEIGDEPGAEG
jgi:4'-phosphopantetheinyl transferase